MDVGLWGCAGDAAPNGRCLTQRADSCETVLALHWGTDWAEKPTRKNNYRLDQFHILFHHIHHVTVQRTVGVLGKVSFCFVKWC